jgi:hypothetical protein
MRWVRGRTVIEEMIAADDIQRVSSNGCPQAGNTPTGFLAKLGDMSAQHRMLQPRTPKAPIALLYDAARKALTAILENQGLRPTSRGQLRAAAGAAGQPRRRPVRRR